jgi:hypothetical protein
VTVIGANLASTGGVLDKEMTCPICHALPPAAPHFQHRAYECLVNYYRKLGEPCPGFDAEGYLLPGDWKGDNINPVERWKLYITKHNLARSLWEFNNWMSAFPSVAEHASPSTTRPRAGRGGPPQ